MEITPVLPGILKQVLKAEISWDEQDLLFKWKRGVSDYVNSWQALPKLPAEGKRGSTLLFG